MSFCEMNKGPRICETEAPHQINMKAKWVGISPEDWLHHVLQIHFHPRKGSSYWLEKARALGIDAPSDIRSLEELALFGPMDEEAMRQRPVEDFIPQCFLKRKEKLVLGETAGTTGKPKHTAYTEEDFASAFAEYFGSVAERRGFPRQGNWLFVGPTGPHIIGKAACSMAHRLGSMDPFTIDFDPRWIKKLLPGSPGMSRYRSHLLQQTMDILSTEEVEVIFTTPPILKKLAQEAPRETLGRVKGIHLGGMAIDAELYQRVRQEWFPQAVVIPGYGNTLFGLSLEVEYSPSYHSDNFPPGPRLIFQIVSKEDGIKPSRDRLKKLVKYGEKGQVVFHRLDESMLILNMFERDEGIRIPASQKAQEFGLFQDGVRNPCVLEELKKNLKSGLY